MRNTVQRLRVHCTCSGVQLKTVRTAYGRTDCLRAYARQRRERDSGWPHCAVLRLPVSGTLRYGQGTGVSMRLRPQCGYYPACCHACRLAAHNRRTTSDSSNLTHPAGLHGFLKN